MEIFDLRRGMEKERFMHRWRVIRRVIVIITTTGCHNGVRQWCVVVSMMKSTILLDVCWWIMVLCDGESWKYLIIVVRRAVSYSSTMAMYHNVMSHEAALWWLLSVAQAQNVIHRLGYWEHQWHGLNVASTDEIHHRCGDLSRGWFWRFSMSSRCNLSWCRSLCEFDTQQFHVGTLRFLLAMVWELMIFC